MKTDYIALYLELDTHGWEGSNSKEVYKELVQYKKDGGLKKDFLQYLLAMAKRQVRQMNIETQIKKYFDEYLGKEVLEEYMEEGDDQAYNPYTDWGSKEYKAEMKEARMQEREYYNSRGV